MTQALYYAPAAAVSPFQYTALIWGVVIGFAAWGDVPTGVMIVGAAIVTASGLYLLRSENGRSRRVTVAKA
jgi:drug/metabolite transporter (DMT)-like permease